VGSLVEMLVTLGHADGLTPVLDLLGAALLVPSLPGHEGADPPPSRRLKSFAHWVALSGGVGPQVVASPLAMARALSEPFELPACPGTIALPGDGRAPVLE